MRMAEFVELLNVTNALEIAFSISAAIFLGSADLGASSPLARAILLPSVLGRSAWMATGMGRLVVDL